MIDNLIWININSTNKIEGNSGNFKYKIEIEKNLLSKLTHVWITNVNIPKWWYTFSNKYNEFHFSENNDIINIFIPIGNYSKNQFFNMISNLMKNASLNNITYTMSDYINTYDTGLIKIVATNNINNIPLKLIFSDDNDVSYAFGFNQYSINNFDNNIIISPNIINLNFANNIILHWNCVQNDINDLNSYWWDVLCNIYCWSFQNFSYIWLYYDLINNMKKFIFPGVFNFLFSNEDNDIVDFNNVELWFTINFFSYISLDKFYKLIKNYSTLKIAEKI